MLDLNLLAVFARVVEAGSFAEAARRLSSSRSAVSKSVAKLEVALGARLLNRTTRHLSLTEIGAAVAEHGGRIVEEAIGAENLVASLASEPRGVLRVSASVAFGTLHVAPALAEFLPRYPQMKVDMTITDRLVDLAEEGYDMAIRVTGEPPLSPGTRRNIGWRASWRRYAANCARLRNTFASEAFRSPPRIWLGITVSTTLAPASRGAGDLPGRRGIFRFR